MARTGLQKETASQDWKKRMQAAKEDLPQAIGQQQVILKVIELDPDVDSLAYATRWRNAWFVKVSDPQLTTLVEKAVVFFKTKAANTSDRLSRQKLSRVK